MAALSVCVRRCIRTGWSEVLKNVLKKGKCFGLNFIFFAQPHITLFCVGSGGSVRANKWEVFVCWSRDNVGVSKYVGGYLRSRQSN